MKLEKAAQIVKQTAYEAALRAIGNDLGFQESLAFIQREAARKASAVKFPHKNLDRENIVLDAFFSAEDTWSSWQMVSSAVGV
jgi:hypothetical protein